MLSTNDDILKAAEDWRKDGRDVALATVVETWGSAPRPVGSNLVIDGEGNFLGSVSGGCVEGAVVTEALDVIESGKPKMLEFGVADETAWKVGLSCGGKIRVFRREGGVELTTAMKLDILTALNAERAARRAAIVVTDVASGKQRLVKAADIAKDPLRAAARRSICAPAKAAWRRRRKAASSSPSMCRRRSSSSPARCISARRWRRSASCLAMT